MRGKAVRNKKPRINKSGAWREEKGGTWETPVALSQASGCGRQSRKDTNSSHASKFVNSHCQHFSLAVDLVTVDSSSCPQLWAAVLPSSLCLQPAAQLTLLTAVTPTQYDLWKSLLK